MKTDQYGVFDKVSVVVDLTTGERASQYFTRLGDAKRKAKHFNAGLENQRYVAHEMHVSPKVSTFTLIERAVPNYRLAEITCDIGKEGIPNIELRIQNVNTSEYILLKN